MKTKVYFMHHVGDGDGKSDWLLKLIRANYALSSKCYKCDPCPNPFDPLSKDVKNATDCKWCATVTVRDNKPKVVRECTSECSTKTWEKNTIRLVMYVALMTFVIQLSIIVQFIEYFLQFSWSSFVFILIKINKQKKYFRHTQFDLFTS
uniref:Uncharacterized protein n=1 Tax=Trichobilharzia regenti TaxID=157069 RepID=A0AA85K5L8_TRIRE|nr:unnamed protein product [Trichobilharzia regenti]